MAHGTTIRGEPRRLDARTPQVDEGVYLLSVACRLISVTRHPRGLSLAREKSRPLHKAA
jgi:hypothetical protein